MKKLTFLALCLAACNASSENAEDMTPLPTPEEACVAFAQTSCDKLNECTPALLVPLYGDVAGCLERTKLGCLPSFGAKDTVATTSVVKACAEAAKSSSCDDLFARNPASACKLAAGPLVDGATCHEDGQCKSTFCQRTTTGSHCGTCATRVAAGGACVDTTFSTDCDWGLQCVGQVCVAPVKMGGTCDGSHPCVGTLACKNGVCQPRDLATSACMTNISGGEPAGTCEGAKGYFCHLLQNVCTAVTYANATEGCGASFSGYALCKKSACSSQLNGTCNAFVADGGACGGAGQTCQPPSRCVGNVCKLPDPVQCM